MAVTRTERTPPGLSMPGIMSCPVPGRTVLLKTDVGKAGLKPKVHHSVMSSHQEKPGLSCPADSKVNADCVWKVVSLASPARAHPAPSIKSYSVSVTMATTFPFHEYCWRSSHKTQCVKDPSLDMCVRACAGHLCFLNPRSFLSGPVVGLPLDGQRPSSGNTGLMARPRPTFPSKFAFLPLLRIKYARTNISGTSPPFFPRELGL